MVQALADLAQDKLHPVAQPDTGATNASKLTKEDGKIDWTKPAAEIECQLRALHPWPGCFFTLNGETIKLLGVSLITDKKGPAGTLLDDQFTVACGEQALRLTSLQRPGKTATDGASLLRGLRLPIGSQL